MNGVPARVLLLTLSQDLDGQAFNGSLGVSKVKANSTDDNLGKTAKNNPRHRRQNPSMIFHEVLKYGALLDNSRKVNSNLTGDLKFYLRYSINAHPLKLTNTTSLGEIMHMRDLNELNCILTPEDDDGQDRENYTAPDDTEIKNCTNCFHRNTSMMLESEPCDGCFDSNEWVALPSDEAPTPCADMAESLYRKGCWTTLAERVADLASEWSLMANGCKYKLVPSINLPYRMIGSPDPDCSKFFGQRPCCFENCPKLKG